MIINNGHMFRTAQKGIPTIKINKKLALQMKWFVENGDQHYRIKMGAIPIIGLYKNTVPDEVNGQTIFWKADDDFIQLSVFCNWRFTNLYDAFRSNWQVNDRLMYSLQSLAKCLFQRHRNRSWSKTRVGDFEIEEEIVPSHCISREKRFSNMTDFYMTVLSQSDLTEFPQNVANSFKNRFVNPLFLMGDG